MILSCKELRPSKAICVGRNYAAHAAELGNEVPEEPLLFMKPTSSIIFAGEAIGRPNFPQVHHEAELCVVMKSRARSLHPENALEHVLGYTCANDITVRELQGVKGGRGPWLRGKGMDTFLPIGPHVETELDPRDLRVQCRVNGQTRQEGRTSQMIFSIVDLLCAITREITLEEHDLVLTGTPHGVGNLAVGDEVEVEIEGIGCLRNPVRSFAEARGQ